MGNPSTWIKLDRNIMKWCWYKDCNTARLFIHLLLKANVKDGMFMGKLVQRGQLITSQPGLAAELGISACKIRTALSHLQTTGEIAVKQTNKYSIITILNYDRYQETPQAKPKSTMTQSKNKRKKENKKESAEPIQNEHPEEPKEYMPLWWEIDKPKEFWGRFKSEDEYWEYRQTNGGE